MKTNIIVTTTSSIENVEIEKYIDLVSTNIVVGTNFFSDLGASLSDLFGGYSDSYQNKLQKIYSTAIENLKYKARNLGADAIVGLKIDFDEISGKGKSMFMISAIGTAIRIKQSNINFPTNDPRTDLLISNEHLEKEINKRRIISNLSNNILPSSEDWSYLLSYPIEEVAEPLVIEYLKYYPDREFQTQQVIDLLNNTSKFFKLLDFQNATRILFSHLKEKPKAIIEILKENKLLSPENIIDLNSKDEYSLAIECSSCEKDNYSKEDLSNLELALIRFENIPQKGKIDLVKSILGKPKEKFICPNGHINETQVEFCQSDNCGLNINGLTRNEIKLINELKARVESLKIIFAQNS